MSLYQVLTYPHVLLKKVSSPVEEFNDNLKEFEKGLIETMKFFDGIGLAAPQVGVLKRMFVMDISPYLENEEMKDWHGTITFKVDGQEQELTFPQTFVNPEFVSQEEEFVFPMDGCLSVPGVSVQNSRRFKKVTMKAFNTQGQELEITCDGIAAICLQHEYDHLEGILFIDKVMESVKEKELRDEIYEAKHEKPFLRKIKKAKLIDARKVNTAF